MSTELLRDIPTILEERTVVNQPSNGRDYTFAHEKMRDVTKRADKRGGTFLSLDSLLDYAEAYGKPAESAIFFNEQEVTLFLNEEWRENIGKLKVEKSKALRRWVNFGGGSKNGVFDQETLIDHIECWAEEISIIYPPAGTGDISIPSFLKTIMELSLKVKISYDRKFQDRNNQSLQFQVSEENGDAAENKAVPKNFKLNIPVLEGAAPQEIDVRLAYHVPRAHGEEAYFYFECPKLDFYIEQAIDKIGEEITSRLGSDWRVFKGKPNQS